MLSLLHIENVAVVEKVDIDFEDGLNVLTGETGAGKSIVIDSLEAALGWRTSKDIVRSGADSATVTACFTGVDVSSWLTDNGLEEGDELILTRRITRDGKSYCRINGSPVPAAQLRELGLLLMDIHGQGDGQRLTDERYHREYLDAFSDIGEELDRYREAYRKMREIKDQLDDLEMDESEKERRIDTLTYQIDEIERAEIRPGEYLEKSARRDLLKSAGKLTDAVRDAAAALYGGETSDGALSLITSAAGSISHVLKYSKEFESIASKLNDLKYATEDAAGELLDLRDKLDFSPEELDELEERLDTLRRIFRKYGGSEEAALEYLDKIRGELSDIESSQELREKLEKQLDKCLKTVCDLGDALTQKRKAGAEALSDKIVKELHELSMPGAEFEVEITELDKPGPWGLDDVRFLIAANKGESIGRISKVASGGELSRVMLAMKTVFAADDSVQSMVFDEIDTGVSGIAAQRVAEKLAAISRIKQVICVTHLPQISVMADTHFSIVKSEDQGRTSTQVTKLDESGREREIARLIGGDNITETTISAAREQLVTAREFKARTTASND